MPNTHGTQRPSRVRASFWAAGRMVTASALSLNIAPPALIEGHRSGPGYGEADHARLPPRPSGTPCSRACAITLAADDTDLKTGSSLDQVFEGMADQVAAIVIDLKAVGAKLMDRAGSTYAVVKTSQNERG